MTHEVAITGFGVFTAFGFGAQALRDGVFAGRPGFSPVTRFDPAPYRAAYAGTYEGDGPSVPDVPVKPGYTPAQADVLDACAAEALRMADTDAAGAPVLLGTNGDYAAARSFWEDSAAGHRPADRRMLDSLPARLAQRLGERHGLGGTRLAFVNACVASTNAIAHGAALVASGAAHTVVCGGAYLVTEDVFAKFDSGKALSRRDRVRPFAADRDGLLQGDGVAVLVLEDAARARARGAEVQARVAGWGMAADAHHVIQPHPQGLGLAAAAGAALRRAGIPPESLGYVNAHGTGTPLNDVAETAALHRILGPHTGSVPVSSTKSSTGHMLEATGAVEAVITLLALRDGVLPPTAGLTEPDPACDLDHIPSVARPSDARYALSLNAAFGGVNAALVLERP
ncbi:MULTISPECIES: beta-ketoacyl-[acyl-carrier-protein] synthase family protein [unclassified Streptomyces]|uniref:beta-ketoacyl-[acyl-carrier-protein] synthase family protein n=1 Tax=unclassified Streptomyces TaxID=2593676 RepID=UPI00247365C4|nr:MULTISPECIES: beta-ketoacyl-[acyl-carrier-protein] synthase family protein [unclassified Streptomyces]MDH6454520.1 3-oxoacyl-[acyl-carrier-protein] synthase II [Streptomyces sp. SAI-119]MDH6494922.1 3-oxoacyl-[acyl-carrier-protein] synthase II [Streptomyces sp. SAI-149]